MLALPGIPTEYSGTFVGKFSVVSIKCPYEFAGRAFYERHEKLQKSQVIEDKENNISSGAKPSKDSENNTYSSSHRKNKKKNFKDDSTISQRVRKALENRQNLYRLVCVPENASFDEIKRTFRKLALILHPDKTNNQSTIVDGLPDLTKMSPEEIQAHYLNVYEAFEILMDPIMRKQYDSYLEFDDTLPSEREIATANDFFALCGPAFEKESRWCVKQPVPSLGDANSPLDQVKNFYKYWANYESWRDFSNAGEYNLEDAQHRDERRWMQRENWRIVKGLIKAERQRVLRFVQAAEANDPRLLAAKNAARQAKLDANKAKLTPTQRAKEEAQAKQRAAAAKKNNASRAIEEAKAMILEKRRIQNKAKKIVRTCYYKWIVEYNFGSDVVENKLNTFIDSDKMAELSLLQKELQSILDRYNNKPCLQGAEEMFQSITKYVQ